MSLPTGQPHARLVSFDGDRRVHGSALPGEVDREVKTHALASGTAHLCMNQGRRTVTDHLRRTQGLLLTDRVVQSSGPLGRRMARSPGKAIGHRNIGPWRVGSMGQPRVV